MPSDFKFSCEYFQLDKTKELSEMIQVSVNTFKANQIFQHLIFLWKFCCCVYYIGNPVVTVFLQFVETIWYRSWLAKVNHLRWAFVIVWHCSIFCSVTLFHRYRPNISATIVSLSCWTKILYELKYIFFYMWVMTGILSQL